VYAVATFIVVAVISLVFTRAATGALIATGLPTESAAFQARSAFTGTGFTTRESENIVNHPARRRILSTTMFVGNLGTPTLIVTVLLGFLAPGPGDTFLRLLVALAGLVAVLMILRSPWVTRYLQSIGERYAQRRLLPAIGHRIDELLTLGDGWLVAELPLGEIPPDAPRSLRGLERALADVQVLGVRRNSGDGQPEFVAEKPADLTLQANDRIVVFGPRERIEALVLD